MPLVLKADGKFEEFSEEKLIASIKRAGISPKIQSQVLEHVKQKVYDKIPTSEIYRHIEEFLGVADASYGRTKYSLKKAIMELGPTGFPFESYVSEILKVLGFETEVGTYLIGKCVKHEVDIIARKASGPDLRFRELQSSEKGHPARREKIMVECKFHNSPGSKCDLQVSLYTKARFEDLRVKHNFSSAMLATNTKITQDGLSYANCEGIRVLSWSYPEGESLRDLIEMHKLYPITQLSFLSFSQKQELLNQDIVLIKQICSDPGVLTKITIPGNKRGEIMKEATTVCQL